MAIPKNLYIFLEYSFLSLFYLISKPSIEITPDKIIISLFCFPSLGRMRDKGLRYKKRSKYARIKRRPFITKFRIDRIKLRILSLILRRLFKRTVELEIIRLRYPFYETNIFVNLLSRTINKIKINRTLYKFFKKAIIFDVNQLNLRSGKNISKIPSFVSGIRLRIAGRLLTQRIVPRKTVKIISKGSLTRGKTAHLEKGRFTGKNKRGAFNIMVTIGHIKT